MKYSICEAEIPAGKNFCVKCGEYLPKEMQVRKCAMCEAEIPDGKNFCVECGEHLPEYDKVRSCAKCGAVIPDGKAFCVECGKHLLEYRPVNKCLKCGAVIPDGKDSCVECGHWQPQPWRLTGVSFVIFSLVFLGGVVGCGVFLVTRFPVWWGYWSGGFLFAFVALGAQRLHDIAFMDED